MLAAIPCQGADVLALVDLDAGVPRGEIPVGGHPVHATVAAGRVFVATMDERSVSVVDLDGGVDTVPTGVLGPSHFALAAGTLFVPCTGGDAVAAIDPRERSLLGRIHAGAEPHEIAVRDGLAYVGSRGDGTVTVFDPATRERLDAIEVAPGARVAGVEAGARGVYAVDAAYEIVVRLSAAGVEASAPVGADPDEVSPVGDRVFVPGRGDDTVREFDPDLSLVAEHGVAGEPVAVYRIDGTDWVLHAGSPRLVALSGGAIELPAPGRFLRPFGDGRALVSHYDDAAVSVIDARSRAVVTTVETPANPFGAVVV